jgi:hypothetical protein
VTGWANSSILYEEGMTANHPNHKGLSVTRQLFVERVPLTRLELVRAEAQMIRGHPRLPITPQRQGKDYA